MYSVLWGKISNYNREMLNWHPVNMARDSNFTLSYIVK